MTLTVLDFNKNITFVYKLKNVLTDDEVSLFLKENNHKVENCTWMRTTNKIIKIDK